MAEEAIRKAIKPKKLFKYQRHVVETGLNNITTNYRERPRKQIQMNGTTEKNKLVNHMTHVAEKVNYAQATNNKAMSKTTPFLNRLKRKSIDTEDNELKLMKPFKGSNEQYKQAHVHSLKTQRLIDHLEIRTKRNYAKKTYDDLAKPKMRLPPPDSIFTPLHIETDRNNSIDEIIDRGKQSMDGAIDQI